MGRISSISEGRKLGGQEGKLKMLKRVQHDVIKEGKKTG
jgi:hypothetical protein